MNTETRLMPVAQPPSTMPDGSVAAKDIAVRRCSMPHELEVAAISYGPVLTLGALLSGAMQLEERRELRSWQGQVHHRGALSLRPPEHEPYDLRWRSRSAEPIQTLDVYIQSALLSRLAEEAADRDATRVAFVERVGFQDPLLLQLSLALHHEITQPESAESLYAQTAATMLGMHLLRHYTTHDITIPEAPRGLTEKQVQRVRDYVQSHIDRDLTLHTLAAQTGLSEYHFARMFRQACGESPHQFVLRQRLDYAQWLLRTTDMPLADIAVASGFGDQSYFTAAFKRRLDVTPSAYRRLMD